MVPVDIHGGPSARSDCGEDFLLFLFGGHLRNSLVDDRNVLDSHIPVKGVMYIIPKYLLGRPSLNRTSKLPQSGTIEWRMMRTGLVSVTVLHMQEAML